MNLPASCVPLCLGIALGALSPGAGAGAVSDRVKNGKLLRVCIWPEYYGVTYRDPRTSRLSGIDVDLSQALAHDLGVKLAYVDTSFVTFIEDLLADRCDLAMFAVGILPQRARRLRFTRPYLESDIYAITTRSNPVVRRWEDIDWPGVKVAVAAGTFMEQVMGERLTQASTVSVRPPATREHELQSGRVDVFMTDYAYSQKLLDNAEWALRIAPPKPFHVIPYGYAMRPGDDDWFHHIDAFVARIQSDGRLLDAAQRHRLEPMVRRH